MSLVASKIRMKRECYNSDNLLEIDEIYIVGSDKGWYKKETIHNHVTKFPKSITVKTSYGPYVIPAVSPNGEKFVKSTPNSTTRDNLLSLPRE